jgi:hypothetical protein
MLGGHNIAEDGGCASTLKALDSELIGIPPGVVAPLPSATTSRTVMDDGCDALPSSHPFQSNHAPAAANVATKQSMADAAPVPPKIDGMQEPRTVSRNASPQLPANIGHDVAVESNSSAASNGTILSESGHPPKDTNPKESLAKTREANDRLATHGIAKDLLGGANAQHSSTFTTCPHPEAAVGNLETCGSQWSGQQPCEVSHDSSSHSSIVSKIPLFHFIIISWHRLLSLMLIPYGGERRTRHTKSYTENQILAAL